MNITRNTIVVANSIIWLNKLGHLPTIGEVANITGLSYYKVKKETEFLQGISNARGWERPHRPNVNKRVWSITPDRVEIWEKMYNDQF